MGTALLFLLLLLLVSACSSPAPKLTPARALEITRECGAPPGSLQVKGDEIYLAAWPEAASKALFGEPNGIDCILGKLKPLKPTAYLGNRAD